MAITVTTQMMACSSRQLQLDGQCHQTWDIPKASNESVRQRGLTTSSLPLPVDAQVNGHRFKEVAEDIAKEGIMVFAEYEGEASKEGFHARAEKRLHMHEPA